MSASKEDSHNGDIVPGGDFDDVNTSKVGAAGPAAKIMDSIEDGDSAMAEGGGEVIEDGGGHETDPAIADDDEEDGNMKGASSGADKKKKGRGPGKLHDNMARAGYGAKPAAAKHKRMERESPDDASDEGVSTTISKTVKKRKCESGKPRVRKAGYAAKAATDLGTDVASQKHKRMERESSGDASEEGMSITTSKAVRRGNGLGQKRSKQQKPKLVCETPKQDRLVDPGLLETVRKTNLHATYCARVRRKIRRA